MKGNLLILHGGGPTAVLNCSLYGAVTEALDSGGGDRGFGAEGGRGGPAGGGLLGFFSVPRGGGSYKPLAPPPEREVE